VRAASAAPARILHSAAGVPGRPCLAGYAVRLLSRLPRGSRLASWYLGLGLAVVLTMLAIAGLVGWSTWHALSLAHDFRFELLIQGIWDRGKEAVLSR
jgi:hypothetical protein